MFANVLSHRQTLLSKQIIIFFPEKDTIDTLKTLPVHILAMLTGSLMLASLVFAAKPQRFSFSPQVGSGSGSSYSLTGDSRITAVRVWEAYSNYIYG